MIFKSITVANTRFAIDNVQVVLHIQRLGHMLPVARRILDARHKAQVPEPVGQTGVGLDKLVAQFYMPSSVNAQAALMYYKQISSYNIYMNPNGTNNICN